MGAHGGPPPGPFKILAINDYVPEKVKPWIFIFLLLIVQIAGGGVYLAVLNETANARALMTEDVQMAGFASMAGMALIFTIMLRLKFRFTSKPILLTCAIGLIICNIICLYTSNVFVLVAACFVAGMLRMWATFECNSTIQLWITPTRDMPVFFAYVYFVVNSVILLGTGGELYVAMFTSWAYVNWLVIGLLLLMILIVVLIFNNRRFMPFMPLFGIDWLGGFMWGLSLLCLNFICIYGEHYDWFDSSEIVTATIFFVVLVGLNIYRASFIRHPFIPLPTFKYKVVYMSLILYLLIDVLIAPSHLIEHIYFEEILGYETEQMITVNLISWTGILVGALFVWRYFAVHKHSFKATFMIGFTGIVLYEIIMYFLIDANTTKEMFALPLFLRNFGYIVIAVVLISDLMKVPFPHFFQSLSVQAFVSAACGSAIGLAVLKNGFSYLATKNFQLISSNIDSVNHNLMKQSQADLSHMIQFQTLLVSFKEIYGYLVILGIVSWLILLLYQYPYFPKNLKYPKFRAIRRMVKKEVENA